MLLVLQCFFFTKLPVWGCIWISDHSVNPVLGWEKLMEHSPEEGGYLWAQSRKSCQSPGLLPVIVRVGKLSPARSVLLWSVLIITRNFYKVLNHYFIPLAAG